MTDQNVLCRTDSILHKLLPIFILKFMLFLFFLGRPGTDYPILSAFPYTNFYCDEQEYPGFFADMETRCQGMLFYVSCVNMQ